MSLFILGDPHLSQQVEKPMDVFGGVWKNYTEKLVRNWTETVSETDTVVIAGDVSWAMNLDDALEDFRLLDNLPGKKILLKGNHDYWWDTVTKMKRFLKENGITTIEFLFNNSFEVDGVWICGTRGWTIETGTCSETDEKIIKREAARLVRSLETAPCDAEKIAVFHYPPIYENYLSESFIKVLNDFSVKRCFYGHLHSASIKKAVTGLHNGINFYLVSADALDFLPLNI